MAILAGGPSLTTTQIQLLLPHVRAGDLYVIGVNDAYRACSFLHLLYAADLHWWDYHAERTRGIPLRVSCLPEVTEKHALVLVQGKDGEGLCLTPGEIHFGQHSGFQALNLAVMMGAATILLLGYDMQPAPDGRLHWFGDHPPEVDRGRADRFTNFRSVYPPAARQLAQLGVTVLNCSPLTALTCFPRLSLHDALSIGPSRNPWT